MNIRRNDLISMPNLLLNKLETRMRRSTLFSKPLTITLEPTLSCNSDCVMCNRNFSRKETKQATGFLSWDTFNRVRPYFKYARNVLFSGFGEALLHPEYTAMLKEIKKSGPFVFFYTNGIAMKEALGKQLVDIGMDRVCISMGGATKETYKKIRGIDAFESVVENIKHIRDYKHKTGRIKPALFFNIVAMNSVLPELPLIVEMARELEVSNIDMPNMVAQGAEMKTESIWLNLDAAKNEFAEAALLAQKYGIGFNPPNLDPGFKSDCRSLFEIMVVNWDGTVMSCALERYVVGDLKESSIDAIWNSKGMVELRRDYYKKGLNNICPRCTCWDNDPLNFIDPALNSREFAVKRL